MEGNSYDIQGRVIEWSSKSLKWPLSVMGKDCGRKSVREKLWEKSLKLIFCLWEMIRVRLGTSHLGN